MTSNAVSFRVDGLNGFSPDLITSFIAKEFPQEISTGGSRTDSILKEIIGTRQTRVGPIPNKDCQEAISKVIRHYVSINEPIPVLVPAAPKKPVCGEGIDIAEFSAVRTMACLNQRVTAHYHRGLNFVVRLEDATGWFLESGVPGLKTSMDAYLEQFENMVKLFGYDSFIHLLRESTLISEDEFTGTASSLVPAFVDFIDASDLAAKTGSIANVPEELLDHGWKGSLPQEQLDFYRARYSKMYPDLEGKEVNCLLAKYLANVLTHRILGISGVNPNWNGHIQLAFVPPVPGTPPSLVSTRVYYRSIPLNVYKRNLPFWRARGYFKFENGTARPALSSWTEHLNLQSCQTTITQGDMDVTIQTNYMYN